MKGITFKGKTLGIGLYIGDGFTQSFIEQAISTYIEHCCINISKNNLILHILLPKFEEILASDGKSICPLTLAELDDFESRKMLKGHKEAGHNAPTTERIGTTRNPNDFETLSFTQEPTGNSVANLSSLDSEKASLENEIVELRKQMAVKALRKERDKLKAELDNQD